MPFNLARRSGSKALGEQQRCNNSTGVFSVALRLEQIAEDAFLPNLMLLLAFLAPLNYDGETIVAPKPEIQGSI
jgi:hypothetical protein